MKKVGQALVRRRKHPQEYREIVAWLVLLGMRWLGEDAFVASDFAKCALSDAEILEQHRIG